MNERDRDASQKRHGIARVLSKQGLCSRSEAARRVIDGRVRINGMPCPCIFDRNFRPMGVRMVRRW